jgi:protein-tyrosine phosphatase
VPSILVVCSGNLCRSPLAEAFLRRRLEERFPGGEVTVRSAGTIAWPGSPATPEGVVVAREHGLDTSSHAATPLAEALVDGADLVLAMAAEHRAAVEALRPEHGAKTFTLKELVRLLDELPPPDGSLEARLSQAHALREGVPPRPDEDVADPIGLPLETYRAVAWELSTFTDRLVEGLFGPTRSSAITERTADGSSR